ncbi:MAG: hypothetical protein GXP63_06310 [DPANN group archaeon]|nr:hypothetical protein [DPANN group archaeon]
MDLSFNCIVCKGRDCKRYCGTEHCPNCERYKVMFRSQELLKTDGFAGFSPTPFVGRQGYPKVNVGLLASPQEIYDRMSYDNPRRWAKEGFDIYKLVDIRSQLVNSRFRSDVFSARKQDKLLELSQEIGMSTRPVDVEVSLEKRPVFRLDFDGHAAPRGPSAALKNAVLTSNPHVDRKVERAVGDTDAKAVTALKELYGQGIDENRLSRLLSIGLLGMKKQRKLVPTRWSITAVDDTLGKELLKKVRDFPSSGYSLLFGSFLGNHYLMLFFPDLWSYELFEMYVPDASMTPHFHHSTDFEPFEGRKRYAQETAGGYYTVRLAILERLVRNRRQASVLALRFVTDDYTAPLGVWVTREASRKAMANRPLQFDSEEDLLAFARDVAQRRFRVDISEILKKSRLLVRMRTQKRLTGFF